MSSTDTTEKTVEKPVVSPNVWMWTAGVLAVVGGVAAGLVVRGITWPATAGAAATLAPFTLTVGSVLLGAGVGLIIADIRQTTTTRTTTTTTTGPSGRESTGPEDVVVSTIEALKDLSAGKALTVLGIVLIVVTMWTVNG